ncbi:protein NO VEIN domain-containing protein [Herminiimonas sp. CN]|uniref:protein NO VEIN domain-containing protein n=1 Tax=Herminiimonas sp. CN TaxID=1349818 RepID=UPI0012DD8A60|nr:DUF3883 domain-containing protein [Herminiimonas sp. CN]
MEVKAVTGSLRDRSVGLSHTQFKYARHQGSTFWLYVVEQASNPDGIRVLHIQDPATHARTFTFDHGCAASYRQGQADLDLTYMAYISSNCNFAPTRP